jgi:ABC-2 type transport system ATP-binding protein
VLALIALEQVSRNYTVITSKKGFMGALHSFVRPEKQIIHAIKDISISIESGESVGFIGPNGAGKSTTIKMLCGILVPSSGKVTVNGLDPTRNRKRHAMNIGVVFGQRTQLWWDLPVWETFELLRHIYRIPSDLYKKNLDTFTSLLELGSFITQPVRQLSLGQRMRADIAAALLHSPPLVFFDEPTIGLDIVAKERIREFIRHINRDTGTTILFTTHDLSDIEKTCARIIIIDKGHKIYDGSIEKIRERSGNNRTLVVDFNERYPSLEIPDATVTDVNEFRKKIAFDRRMTSAKEMITRITSEYDVFDLTIKEPEIEEIVRGIYEGQLQC